MNKDIKITCSKCGWLAVKGDILLQMNDELLCARCLGFYTQADLTDACLLERKEAFEYIAEKFRNCLEDELKKEHGTLMNAMLEFDRLLTNKVNQLSKL